MRDEGEKARRSGEDGFTLIELLVVLAILALLTAIATPQVLKYLASAKVSAAHTQVESLSSALDLYKLDVGRYPNTQEGLSALVAAPAGVDSWNGPYVKKKTSLVDPWGHPYGYRSPGEHGEFDLYSDGPDTGGTQNGGAPAIT
ncbi:type II secretion system major pseudopilin GspG, partial [Parvibaculum sp.]|uniref:type II secretion system major pseudopilin GspG n=1 Tax=Parvibaculum sp. TaxID=2024848 RepID=UPI002C25A4A2